MPPQTLSHPCPALADCQHGTMASGPIGVWQQQQGQQGRSVETGSAWSLHTFIHHLSTA